MWFPASVRLSKLPAPRLHSLCHTAQIHIQSMVLLPRQRDNCCHICLTIAFAPESRSPLPPVHRRLSQDSARIRRTRPPLPRKTTTESPALPLPGLVCSTTSNIRRVSFEMLASSSLQ